MNNELNTYFDNIKKSREYQKFIEAKDKISKNKEILKMINDINTLQKKLCQIDYNDTINYVDTKEELDGIIDVLNSILEYKEYNAARENLLNSIKESKKIIEEYIDSVV